MKKFYNQLKIEVIKFDVLEDVLTISNPSDIEFNQEFDGDTTTIPGDWQ